MYAILILYINIRTYILLYIYNDSFSFYVNEMINIIISLSIIIIFQFE